MNGAMPEQPLGEGLAEKGSAWTRARAWVRPEVRALRAYHVPPAEGPIKLDAMENPYPWPTWLVEQWLGRLRQVAVNRYPDPSCAALKQRLRQVYGVPAGMDLVLGNGSDELIQMLAMTVGGEGRAILSPEPGFVMYRLIGTCLGMGYVGVPLREDFGLDTQAMLAAIDAHRPALVFLAYPNNPTGNLFDAEAVAQVVAAAPGLAVVDEAYFSFAEASFLDRLEEFPNLVVMRTLSKMGLAGLRLGWMAGRPEWLGEAEKTRLPYNINVLTQHSADFALAHAEVFEDQTARIRDQRARLASALGKLPGVTVFPSAANFLLLRVPAGRADRLYAALREDGILIKNLHGSATALRDCLRVTVGTEEENRMLVERMSCRLAEAC
jgi:histidinol-phosphate aminotransferase